MNVNGVMSSSKEYNQYLKNFYYNKKQLSVLQISILTAGIGFLATFLIALIAQQIDKHFPIGRTTLALLSTISIFTAFILAIIWNFRFYKTSTTYSIFTISLYCLAFGIGFGFLFNLLRLSEIIYSFAVVSLILLITFLVSKVLSAKQAFKLGKFIFISSIVFLVVFFIYTIVAWFVGSTTRFWLQTLVSGVSGILSILFLTYNLWLAQNMDNFLNENSLTKKLGIFIGFQILVNLLNLLMIVMRLLLSFRRF